MVQFYLWFKFYFPLFWGMVMYDNEFETKENKIEPQHIHVEGKIFRSDITAIYFSSPSSHSFLPNAFLFWTFF